MAKHGHKEKRRGSATAASSAAGDTSADPLSEKSKKEEWAAWERKVETIGKRVAATLAEEWRAHIPAISPPGSPPSIGVFEIASVADSIPLVKRTGALVQDFPGIRSLVLHEAIYMLHKAVHVQIDVADAVAKGRHTWAFVNAYQASLFALSAVLGILGITNDKAPAGGEGVILIDVWPSEARQKSGSITGAYNDDLKMVRFRELDHYQKWAVLKRTLRQTTFSHNFYGDVREALDQLKDKEHAKHRNRVNYVASAWLTDDLLSDVIPGPYLPATSFQTHYDNIYQGGVDGTVSTMVALIEIGVRLLRDVQPSGATASPILEAELDLLDRRLPSKSSLCSVDWTSLP